MSGVKDTAIKVLKGWLELPKRRVSKDLQFFRLRGYTEEQLRHGGPIGAFQLVSRASASTTLGKRLSEITPESCVTVTVEERLRPTADRRYTTDKAELYDYDILDLQVDNAAGPLPFLPNQEADVNNAVRAQHRYIEMRSTRLSQALHERSRIKSRLRQELERQNFLEVETPLLFKSTPEGAREFLVPTRKKGQFFALPQSPQQYKQILMAGGVQRYYQFAKCFRDEGGRADRQLEFTQLDLEMAYVTQEDVMAAITKIVLSVQADMETPMFRVNPDGSIPRMKYIDAMTKYGSDKPDLRFNLEIETINDETAGDTIDLIQVALPEDYSWSNKHTDELRDMLKHLSVQVSYNSPDKKKHAPLYKEFSDHITPISPSTLTLLCRRPRILTGGSTSMGQARLLIHSFLQKLKLVPALPDRPFHLCWITDFPLFSPASTSDPGQSGTSGYAATHHPFTAPFDEDLETLKNYNHSFAHDTAAELSSQAQSSVQVNSSGARKSGLDSIRGQHYDLVMNGQEIGGGSIRIHDPTLQRTVFDVLGMSDARIAQFTHLLRALGSGCPPHGGFALGLDRFVAMVCGRDSIKDVIAFPKTTGGSVDAVVGAPSAVSQETLREYHIVVTKD